MRDVEKLIANQGSKTVRDIYETIQHWSWHDLSIMQDLIMEPSIWITGHDDISFKEELLVNNDKRLVSVLAGLKCFWLLENSSAKDIHFFDLRKDNLEIKKQMFDWLYVDKVDPREKLVDLNPSFRYNKEDPLWDKIGKRDVSDCTVHWDLINVVQHPEYLIDRMDVIPGSIYLSNIFDRDNESTWLYDNFKTLQDALWTFRRKGGKVWLHGNGFIE